MEVIIDTVTVWARQCPRTWTTFALYTVFITNSIHIHDNPYICIRNVQYVCKEATLNAWRINASVRRLYMHWNHFVCKCIFLLSFTMLWNELFVLMFSCMYAKHSLLYFHNFIITIPTYSLAHIYLIISYFYVDINV